METSYDFDRNLINHRPSDDAIPCMEDVRKFAIILAQAIDLNCPPSREKSLAFTNLEQTVMWAVAAIARQDWDDRGRPE